MMVVIYTAIFTLAIVMNTTTIPSLASQSLMTQVQIQAMADLRQEIVTISSPESYNCQQIHES